MEALLKETLGTVLLKPNGRESSGCISQGQTYITDNGHIFIKYNNKTDARRMFDGELEGLNALAATKTIKVPTPMKSFNNPEGGAILVMEHLEMKSLSAFSKELGEKLADLHLHNSLLKTRFETNNVTRKDEDTLQYVNNFGFHVATCCGYLPQDNSWCDNWVTFFSRLRLEHQITLLEKNYGDREIMLLWSQLQLEIPSLFKGVGDIQPSLVHGDLWGGNVAETNHEPVVFDPAVFYGHHEYDLAIAGMFGGFSRTFYNSYHKRIPKASGYEMRLTLYQLFHYLNHYNHFGTSYRNSCISTMKHLLKK